MAITQAKEEDEEEEEEKGTIFSSGVKICQFHLTFFSVSQGLL